jgi:hypothetical protein
VIIVINEITIRCVFKGKERMCRLGNENEKWFLKYSELQESVRLPLLNY